MKIVRIVSFVFGVLLFVSSSSILFLASEVEFEAWLLLSCTMMNSVTMCGISLLLLGKEK